MLRYILKHWRGDFPLVQSFWVNFFVPLLVLHWLQPLLVTPLETPTVTSFLVAALWLVVFGVVLFTWQIVGVVRSAERAIRERRDVIWIRLAQGTVVLSLVVLCVDVLALIQTGFRTFSPADPPPSLPPPPYTIEWDSSNNAIRFNGIIDIGATNGLSDLMGNKPSVDSLYLSSAGGHVAEGRGIARLVRDAGLKTIVEDECSSSCTIAFMGGVHRSLNSTGRLGFHSYKLHSSYWAHKMSPEEELEKDLEFYREQGVSGAFLKRIRNTPHDQMWYPTYQELMSAGVLTSTPSSDP